jgi:hypothetical protein
MRQNHLVRSYQLLVYVTQNRALRMNGKKEACRSRERLKVGCELGWNPACKRWNEFPLTTGPAEDWIYPRLKGFVNHIWYLKYELSKEVAIYE